ncbi:glycosyltransferase family 61 protein [Calothrix sp. UHCC 0171]|uniref:glycosyltransferase family 61 protein n=1 Tax=Calothrix sp. UHCC 0171 TaxID=3110245 RepID=UPI002B1FA404|nr:glycosyltransferase family 61 protein [Calothrix sp. UHCC 0171]MEA5573192.1 glycosyltransferase family 61 protein [Calothrix sp. UHCC 0171]
MSINGIFKIPINLLRRHQQEKVILTSILKLLNLEIIQRKQLVSDYIRYTILYFGSQEYVQPKKPNNIGEIPEAIKITSVAHTISQPFVSEIANAQLVGSTAIGFDNKANIIAETTLPPVGDLSPRYQGSIPLQSLLIKKLPELKTHQLSTACSLVSLWSKTYYHWFLDFLTRIEGLEYYQEQAGCKPLLIIDSNPTSWQIESLKLVGYSLDDCIQWDKTKVTVKKLVVPAFRQPGNWVSPSALHWLRQRIFSNLPTADINQHFSSKRIYISRSQASGRRVINEDEVMQFLAPYGFVSYSLETMNFMEQIQLFSSAEIIIGPHGAGFTNIIFSQKQPIVIEFVTPWVSPHYYLISNILDFPYWCLDCRQPYSEKLRESRGDMIVDINNLNHLFKKLSLQN